MKILAVIPARGGSKGIKNKNIIDLNGMPLIHYMLSAAKESSLIDKLIVSTDDDRIKESVGVLDVEVLMRPDEFATDTASSESVLLHALTVYKDFDIIVMLQCTSPFITTKEIDGCIQTLIDNDANSSLTVYPFHHFIWQSNNDTWGGVNFDSSNKRERRQDKSPQYLETGAVYCMKVKEFIQTENRFIPNIVAHIQTSNPLEIDTYEDLKLAENILKNC